MKWYSRGGGRVGEELSRGGMYLAVVGIMEQVKYRSGCEKMEVKVRGKLRVVVVVVTGVRGPGGKGCGDRWVEGGWFWGTQW